MQERIIDKLSDPFKVEKPLGSDMVEQIDAVLPALKGRSSGLNNTDLYVDRWWIEMNDDPDDTRIRRVYFDASHSLEYFVDGVLEAQSWENRDNRKMTLGSSMQSSTLYHLGFLDEDVLILRRDGNLNNLQYDEKYRLFVREELAAKFDWDEALEYVLNKYKSTAWPYILTVLALVTLILLMLTFGRGTS